MSQDIPVGIHSSDMVQLLRREGIEVASHRLRYAARAGTIPAPFKTASGNMAWPPDDLPLIAKYFRNPRRQGRPKSSLTL